MERKEEIFVSTMMPILDEKARRLFLAAYSECLGRGAITELNRLTGTKTVLKVHCAVDANQYERGIKVSDKEQAALNLVPDEWYGEWNYVIAPQVTQTV